jgi:glycosyltransferase involved in cell wall biosynthesis
MKILLTQHSVYLPTWGGANKENKVMLEGLAERGHACTVVAPAYGFQTSGSLDASRAELAQRGIVPDRQADADVFDHQGVHVVAVTDPRRTRARLSREIQDGRPDLVLVASEDPGQSLLDAALRVTSRIVYVARTTLALPFGPGTIGESARGVDLIRRVAGTIVVSEFLKNYFRQWAGLEAVVLPISVHGPGPFADLARYDNPYVTMINPCAYKGLPIFLEMARRCRDLAFAAVPTWGTTEEDRRAIEREPNIRLLPAVDDIEEILAVTRALVVPSLWAENKARIITEAMLRGIPVLASDVGGNGEAKLGVDYLLPVDPIVAFHNRLDERMLPVPIVPAQNAEPWVAALRELLASESSYARVALDTKAAALAANEAVTIDPVEDYLTGILDTLSVAN